MDLLEYVRQRDDAGTSAKDEVEVDYRLLCSGILHRELTGDWTKSDAARMLLDRPLKVFVASAPIDQNPQELSLRFRIGSETLVSGNSHFTYTPDDEVAEDFASFLTAVTHRLVTVLGRSRTLLLNHRGSLPADVPHAIYNLRARHWPPRGVSVLYGPTSVEVLENDPPPLAVDPESVARQLRALAQADAQDVLRAVRLYAAALEVIVERPQVAHLLLVSTIETLAAELLKKWAPTEDEQVRHHGAVAEQAKKFGLSEEHARALAVTASRREYWIKKKFVKFITDRVGDEVWTDNDLFPVRNMWQPDRAKLTEYLGAVYDSRSEAVHEGRPLPVWLAAGTSHLIDARAFHELLGGAVHRTPPMIWFEKVVSICLRARIQEVEQAPWQPSTRPGG